MNKDDAKKKIEELKATLSELQAIVDAPENPLGIFIPKIGDVYWITNTNHGSIKPTPDFTEHKESIARDTYGFKSREVAMRWDKTLDTLLQLRAQHGATSMEKAKWSVIYNDYHNNIGIDKVYPDTTAAHPAGHIVLGYFDIRNNAILAKDNMDNYLLIEAGKTLIGKY